MFVLAQEAGQDWPERAYRASTVLSGSGTKGELGNGTKVLLAVFDYFIEHAADKATPLDLTNYLNARDDLWQLDAQRLSYYLKNYDLVSRASNGKKWFYREDVLETVKTWQADYYTRGMEYENPPLGTTALTSQLEPQEHYKAQREQTKQDMDEVLSKLDANMVWE